MHRIRLTLAGFTLPCGCLVGVYETYSGTVVRLLDARASGCTDEQHQRGAEIDWVPGEAAAPPEQRTEAD